MRCCAVSVLHGCRAEHMYCCCAVRGLLRSGRSSCGLYDFYQATWANTGDHSIQDKILFQKIGKYIAFCVYHRSYELWPPVIVDHTGVDYHICLPKWSRSCYICTWCVPYLVSCMAWMGTTRTTDKTFFVGTVAAQAPSHSGDKLQVPQQVSRVWSAHPTRRQPKKSREPPNQSTDQPEKKTINKINQSVNQRIHLSMSQPTHQPINQPSTVSINQPIQTEQSSNQPTHGLYESNDQPTNQPTNPWSHQSTRGPSHSHQLMEQKRG